jgi:hypothetical protein
MQNNSAGPSPRSTDKSNLKGTNDLNLCIETIKLLEKCRSQSNDLAFGNRFLGHQMHNQQKKKIHKLKFVKIKNFCASKNAIRKRKKPTEGENIYKSYM